MFINPKVHEDFHKAHKGAMVFFVHSWCSLWLLNSPLFRSHIARGRQCRQAMRTRRCGGISADLTFLHTFLVKQKSMKKKGRAGSISMSLEFLVLFFQEKSTKKKYIFSQKIKKINPKIIINHRLYKEQTLNQTIMKKITNYLLFFTLCFLPFAVHAQCPKPSKSTEMSVNNIRALFKTNGAHFFKENAEFEVPKGSGKTTMFAASLWLGGKDAQDKLHLAAMQYGQSGNDFWAGPVSNNGAEAGNFYDKFWRVSKAQVDNHIANYENPGYVVPENIANWPAHGRSGYGESANLAPYVSVSGNSKYTPEEGDYPLIRGDEAIFWINNDLCGKHTESGGDPLGVEILSMAYAHNAPEYEMQHTTFLSYQIRNKSTNNYKDFYVGLFADFDIGFSDDDYIGCDSLLNLAYGYNGYETDGTGEFWAYGANPPAQGVMFLNQKMNTFMYFNNDESPIGDPEKANEYYNYLQGKWKDGRPLTYGGIGYEPGNTNYTKFAFSGDPVTQTGWTEFTPDGTGSTPNHPADRRGMMSAGPFTLNAGECIIIDIALPFAMDMEGNNVTSVAMLKQNAQKIQQFYNKQNYDMECTENFQPELCEKPTALLGVADTNNAVITWNEPETIDGILTGYNIYRDNNKIETTSGSVKEFVDKNLDKGTYIYQVSATYLHCAESELTEGVSVEITTNVIRELQTTFSNIYPNPASGIVNIEGAELNFIEIYDVVGRKLTSNHQIISSSQHLINISHLQAGIYYIKLYMKENQIDIKRLVIVK